MEAALTAIQDMILMMADAHSETPSAQSKSLESVYSAQAATIWISNWNVRESTLCVKIMILYKAHALIAIKDMCWKQIAPAFRLDSFTSLIVVDK